MSGPASHRDSPSPISRRRKPFAAATKRSPAPSSKPSRPCCREVSDALLAPDFSFTSPYDDAISRAAFFTRCWPPGDHFADLQIERVTADTEGSYVTYLVTTEQGAQFRNTEYLTISGGQIHAIHVYFGASYAGGKSSWRSSPNRSRLAMLHLALVALESIAIAPE